MVYASFHSLYSRVSIVAVVVDASVLLALQLIFHPKILFDKSHISFARKKKKRDTNNCTTYNTEYIKFIRWKLHFSGSKCVYGGQSAKQCHRYNKWLHLFVNISKQMYSIDGDVETLNNKTLSIKRFRSTHVRCHFGCFTLFGRQARQSHLLNLCCRLCGFN